MQKDQTALVLDPSHLWSWHPETPQGASTAHLAQTQDLRGIQRGPSTAGEKIVFPDPIGVKGTPSPAVWSGACIWWSHKRKRIPDVRRRLGFCDITGFCPHY